jgi:transcriptional regulator with XRE-family HTH domain
MKINKIGSTIKYFREMDGISQGQLCRGLCSVATLSRVEAGDREIDSYLLITLLERLGKSPNQFEMILTEQDYMLYNYRDKIKKCLDDKNWSEANQLLRRYEQMAGSKITVHNQFIAATKAALNDIREGSTELTIQYYQEAISYTVPNFQSISLDKYYYSITELSIIVEIIQRMRNTDERDKAKKLLNKLLNYYEIHFKEANSELYPKVIIMLCQEYIQEEDYGHALELCDMGIEINKNSRKLDFRGELYLLKARLIERLYKLGADWEQRKKECIKLYLQAHYVFDFCEEHTNANQILEYLQEEYQWGCIGWGI